jgi:thymidine phosphorylase
MNSKNKKKNNRVEKNEKIFNLFSSTPTVEATVDNLHTNLCIGGQATTSDAEKFRRFS